MPAAGSPPDPPDLLGGALERPVEEAGSHPGDRYVRIERADNGAFRLIGKGLVEATERAGLPGGPRGVAGRVSRFLLGRPLSIRSVDSERLSIRRALPILSSDALSSMAYGPEAGLVVLAVAGAGALAINLPIGIAVSVLVVLVVTSYRQVIFGHPQGGGSYAVARANLGILPGLIAAAALVVDYILTVAVSVSSGVDALISAFGSLEALKLVLGLVFIALLAIGNLRGVREAGAIFAAPTYLFVGSFLALIGVGLVRGLFLGAAHRPFAHFPPIPHATTTIAPFLILTAFATGCSSMTGIEAVSNGVPSFRPPAARNAARTLVVLGIVLITLLLGVDLLDLVYSVVPQPNSNPTVVAQIATQVFGGPGRWFFYVIQFSTTLVLILAANTSFNGLPRLGAVLARDDHLPHRFAHLGGRLVYSTAIGLLATAAALLLVAFNGNTNDLINLYALGVFTAFTLAQGAMVRHWWVERGPHWRRNVAINGTGAAATLVVDLVIIVTKTPRGAWVVLIVIPLLVALFAAIGRHYRWVRRQLGGHGQALPLTLGPVVVPYRRGLEQDSSVRRALAYARAIGGEVVPVPMGGRGDRLRSVSGLLAIVDRLRDAGGPTVTVVLPERVAQRGWADLVRRPWLLRMKLALLRRPGVVAASLPTGIPSDGSRPDALAAAGRHVALVPVAGPGLLAERALLYASRIATEVIPVHVASSEGEEDARALELAVAQFRRTWDPWVAEHPPSPGSQLAPAMVIASPFRVVVDPLLAYISAWRLSNPEPLCTVVMPELVVRHWWRQVLHNHRAFWIKQALLSRSDIAVADVTCHLGPAG